MGQALIVYQAYSPVSQTFYIGKTVKPIWVRRSRHAKDAADFRTGSIFHRAIRKYGIDTFEWCVLHWAESVAEMDRAEKKWILAIKRSGHKTYNMRPGGDGGSYPGEGSPNFGKITPKDVRDKIAKGVSDYYKNRPGSMTGRSGDLAPFSGRTHSEEARRKISVANKGRKRKDILGSKNPSARAVVCLETGERFDTASDAASKYSADLSGIIKVCKGKKKTVSGRRFSYADAATGAFGWEQIE